MVYINEINKFGTGLSSESGEATNAKTVPNEQGTARGYDEKTTVLAKEQGTDCQLIRQGSFFLTFLTRLTVLQGAKIEKRIVEIKEQLAKYQREGAGDDVESMTAILAGLKIVEKRPSAAFFKKRELIEEKEIGTKKKKFHTHRTKEYNEKAKENQPIKTVCQTLIELSISSMLSCQSMRNGVHVSKR